MSQAAQEQSPCLLAVSELGEALSRFFVEMSDMLERYGQMGVIEFNSDVVKRRFISFIINHVAQEKRLKYVDTLTFDTPVNVDEEKLLELYNIFMSNGGDRIHSFPWQHSPWAPPRKRR